MNVMLTAAGRKALVAPDEALTSSSWVAGLRVDLRKPEQLRPLEFVFPAPDRAVVRLGETAVAAAVACELVDPSPYMPKHGFLEFVVRGTDGAAKQGSAGELTRALEAHLKASGCIDTESLCVLPGVRVWSLQVSVTILNDAGNLTDAAVWAALAALRQYRRPELSIRNDTVVVHPPKERDPVPLSLHHTPVSVTAAIMPDGRPLLDPTSAEAAAASTLVTVAVNAELQACAVHKHAGAPVRFAAIQTVLRSAGTAAPAILKAMDDSMERTAKERKAATLAQFEWAQKRTGIAKRAREDDAAQAE